MVSVVLVLCFLLIILHQSRHFTPKLLLIAEHQPQDSIPSFQSKEGQQHIEQSIIPGVIANKISDNAQVGGEKAQFFNSKCWYSKCTVIIHYFLALDAVLIT